MEKFMYIFHGGSSNAPEMRSPEAMQAHMQKWFAWVEKLRKEGRYVSGEPLQPSGKMVTGKKKLVTDGPFAEGKEVVGGFFIIEAKDINEATELAKDCPDFIYDGAVQVRPVQKM
ncbi:MAG TPA: YciI family protein [Cyclobacteriaceae bacterium]|jgi:hypothetical protein|nr:YciI family protein [Cyclobacteriaceae bacterium]